MSYCVYIAELENGQLYVGITNNPDRRSLEHAEGKEGTRTSRVFGFRKIIYTEWRSDKLSALKRERQLTKGVDSGKEACLDPWRP